MKNIPNELKEAKEAVLSCLSSELAKCSFLFRRKNDRFIRQHGEVTDRFQLVWLDAKPGFRIQPHVGIRIEQVENIFHQTSGFETKYQKETPTMGGSIGILLTGSSRSCEFLLESKVQAAPTVKKIVDVFYEFALPYFDQWGSLAAIDTELNDRPRQRTHQRALAWFRCSTGIIVAKLVGRSDYDQLAEIYEEVMTLDNRGFYLKRFQALLKSLESVESGSGLGR